jgi:hypothetical protein
MTNGAFTWSLGWPSWPTEQVLHNTYILHSIQLYINNAWIMCLRKQCIHNMWVRYVLICNQCIHIMWVQYILLYNQCIHLMWVWYVLTTYEYHEYYSSYRYSFHIGSTTKIIIQSMHRLIMHAYSFQMNSTEKPIIQSMHWSIMYACCCHISNSIHAHIE